MIYHNSWELINIIEGANLSEEIKLVKYVMKEVILPNNLVNIFL